MKKVRLFIAMSLDGYIADQNGGVDWLQELESGDSYSEFVTKIDTILMGWNTWHQIVTELSPTEWVYRDFNTYVITRAHTPQEPLPSEKICFTKKNPVSLLKELKAVQGKDIWICGGASIVQQLIEEDAIDQYHISVIPIILGSGIRLFGHTKRQYKLKLQKTQTNNGITDLVYTRR